jgi:hypothetical protein
MSEETIDQQGSDFVEIPEDYKSFVAYRETGELPPAADQEETPAVGEDTPPSESSDESEETEEGQTAAESDTPEEEGQDEEEKQEPEPDQPKDSNRRLNRRMRTLTGKIAELEARLAAQQGGTEEEPSEEAASSPETETETDQPLVRPKLADFEDTDEKSAWDQYEEAMDAFHEKRTEQKLATALATKEQELNEQHARQTAQKEWNEAASRFPDYNEVVREEVKISSAMESVLRMDPVAGTELAYYLGQHPEESERIAKATLATNEREWGAALARAGMLLGEVRSKLTPPAKAAEKTTPKAAAPAPPPQPKKVSTASRPPAQIKGRAVPKTDVTSEGDAGNYKKWRDAREAQLKKR